MADKTPVTLFVQCLVDSMYPEVAEAVVKIFDRLDIEIDCPTDQTCCGQPAFNSGYRKQARVAAKRFIQIFESAKTIVCPSGSCVTMVRQHYPELFKDDTSWQKRAKLISEKTFELTEYLVDILKIQDMGVRLNKKVTYHESCHLSRFLGIKDQPRKLLSHIRDIQFVEMKDADRCCGFGGTFAVKYPEISSAILEDKVRNIIATDADIVVGCDMSCLMNIEGFLSRNNLDIKTLHIAQLLSGCH